MKQDVEINDFSMEITFKIFNLRFDKISLNACFKFICFLLETTLDILGTNLNIIIAQNTPRTDNIGILSNPQNWVTEADKNGPTE